jgi:hypothetical protein
MLFGRATILAQKRARGGHRMKVKAADEAEPPYTPVKGWKSAPEPDDVKAAVKVLLNARDPLPYVNESVLYGAEDVTAPLEIIPALQRALEAKAKKQPAYLELICSQHPVHGSWPKELQFGH